MAFLLLCLLLPACASSAAEHDANIPQIAFAAAEVDDAIAETGRKGLKVTISVKLDPANPEAFQVRVAGPNESRSSVPTPMERCMAVLKSLSI